MKSRFFLLLAVVLFMLGLVIWFLRDTEQTVLTPSPTLSNDEKSKPAPVQSIPTSTRPPPVPLVDVLSSVVTSPPPDIQEQSKEIAPSTATATKGDTPAIGIDMAIIERVKQERVPLVDTQSRAILFALNLYYEQIGAFPTGDSRSVSLALAGENDRRIVFIEGHGWTNTQGELLDPWHMPYVFNLESNTVMVKSSGPNRMLGDTDDVVRAKSY